jgi:hypothetical protein
MGPFDTRSAFGEKGGGTEKVREVGALVDFAGAPEIGCDGSQWLVTRNAIFETR